MRKELKSLRNRLSKEEVAAKSSSICRKILGMAAYRNAGTVFAYLAFGNEVNIDGVISQALNDGKSVCVPVVTGPHSMQAVKLDSLNCIKEARTASVFRRANRRPLILRASALCLYRALALI